MSIYFINLTELATKVENLSSTPLISATSGSTTVDLTNNRTARFLLDGRK